MKSPIGLLVACSLLLVTSQLFGQDEPKDEQAEMLEQRIRVTHEGEPIEGAIVTPSGLRTDQDPGSHYGWREETHGPRLKGETDENGTVVMKYPKYIYEKMKTSEVTWSVNHKSYVQFREDRRVEEEVAEIELEAGFRIAVTTVNGETGDPIKENIYALMSGSLGAEWDLKNGILVSRTFGDMQSSMRVVYIPENGPKLFSELIDIEPGKKGSRVFLKKVKLFPGVQVKGRIDEAVTRPIRNGYVSAAIIAQSDSADGSWESRWMWNDKAEIDEDGNFVFDSLPAGDVLQMIPVCDNWVGAEPSADKAAAFFGERGNVVGTVQMPQLIRLDGESVQPVLKMKKAVQLEIQVNGPKGPVSDCQVFMWPNQVWFRGGSQILGAAYPTEDWLTLTREEIENQFAKAHLQDGRFQAKTDKDGKATIFHLPGGVTEGIAVEHDLYELPATDRNRSTTVDLALEGSSKITLELQEKGLDQVGEKVDDD